MIYKYVAGIIWKYKKLFLKKFNFGFSIPFHFNFKFHIDFHFIIKELAEEIKKQVTCLGENTEKYITLHFQ